MIETLLYNFINQRASVNWHMLRPETEPTRYGLFEKTGATKSEHITTSTFAFQSYAPTLLEAAQISEELRGIVESSVSEDEICKVTLTGEYNFTNPQTKQPRYQAVFSIVHY